MSEDQYIQSGVNDGYLIAWHAPSLIDVIVKIQAESSYVLGLRAGIAEFTKRKEHNRLEGLRKLRGQSNDKSNDRDK